MTSSAELPQQAAAFLYHQRESNTTCPLLPDELHPRSLDEAYECQDALVALMSAGTAGATAGYKIALTSQVAQTLCNATHPVYGRLFSGAVHESGITLAAAQFGTRIVEVEFGFLMASDVPSSAVAYDATSIRPHVAGVYPSIELVDHHYGGLGGLSAQSIIADNAIHGAWIHGEVCTNWQALDLVAMQTSLHVNGTPNLTGAGDRTLAGPLDALAWLANQLAAHGGGLKIGDCVTSGLTTDGIYDAVAGDALVARFDGLGEVRLSFR
jgi:2-keto-4-pentenoate hydratase